MMIIARDSTGEVSFWHPIGITAERETVWVSHDWMRVATSRELHPVRLPCAPRFDPPQNPLN